MLNCGALGRKKMGGGGIFRDRVFGGSYNPKGVFPPIGPYLRGNTRGERAPNDVSANHRYLYRYHQMGREQLISLWRHHTKWEGP